MDKTSCRKIVLLVAVLALALAAGSQVARAQAGHGNVQDNVYALGYYTNAHTTGAPDGTLRLVNDGDVSDASPAGDLCAQIYVFDNNEELSECCSCRVTPNGYLALGVNGDLTGNTVTGSKPPRGVIKVISSPPPGSVCDPTIVNDTGGIRGWITHPQKATAGFQFTEEELINSNLSAPEENDLAEDCAVAMELGSGQGVCSCTDVGR